MAGRTCAKGVLASCGIAGFGDGGGWKCDCRNRDDSDPVHCRRSPDPRRRGIWLAAVARIGTITTSSRISRCPSSQASCRSSWAQLKLPVARSMTVGRLVPRDARTSNPRASRLRPD